MDSFVKLFGRARSVIIGMVHVRALPGSPCCHQSVHDVTQIALKEAEVLANANVDAILMENMHDRPWQQPQDLGPETTAAMATVCSAVRQAHPGLPLGVQVLVSGNREALAVAKATGLNFVRAEGFVFSHVGDRGFINSCAADIVRYRRNIGAEDVLIFTDIKKKHCSHAITSDISVSETAKAADLFMSDGVIVTGSATGVPTDALEVKEVSESVKIPVMVGSGVTTSNVHEYMHANAIIVGSHLKTEDKWHNELEPTQVHSFMRRVFELRQKAIDEQQNLEVNKGMFAQGE
ncbi:hypothetical protein CAPTEDRAFT_150087 [Capitella teleta]|uniref:BtpA family membrane complex biogenesis protein n=1 Tax=Capitella teleta TaxID=283909 RepID=R7T8K0_CAPTE|nr:hypothetical protein CAPTEDRAFT_150087 [Capitella teleta]|eukprot:ELT87329.1 hypothetical protein CAPTEDRAFT_150087 [Capitella teleta]